LPGTDFDVLPLERAGREWIVDALGCPPGRLRDEVCLRALVARIVEELGLRPVAPGQWHVFPGEGGMTALVLLAESHLALHTFPELGLATFNLYCCRPRPEWPWAERLADALDAARVTVRALDRGEAGDVGEAGEGAP
jgi:S-adenosylmethionine decarboxylase